MTHQKRTCVKFLSAVLVSVAMLSIVSNVIIRFQTKWQLLVNNEILGHSELVSTEIMASVDDAIKARINGCDRKSLDILRAIVWNYKYVVDLGIVDNGRIICTAGLGVLNEGFGNIASWNVSGDEYFYHRIDNLFPNNKRVIYSTLHLNVIAFTSPYAHDKLKVLYKNLSVKISSKNNKYIFSKTPNDVNNEPLFFFKNIETQACSITKDVCVVVNNKYGGLFSLPVFEQLLIFIFCLLFGSGISFYIGFCMRVRKSFEYRLKNSIHNNNLYLEYQPVVRVSDENIVGVEALIRWDDKFHGKASPEVFIPVSERIDYYKYISKFIVKTVAEDLTQYLIKNKNFFVSINIGNYEINSPEYLDFLYDVFIKNGVEPYQIKIEITERSTESYNKIAFFAYKAIEKGFRVSLDDFGTGSANLTWLAEIEFNEIKIDKFYIKGLQNEHKRTILLSVLQLASGRRAQIVFEGVENKYELDFIKKYDMNANVQGWYFYKSLSKFKLFELLGFNER